MLQHSKYLPLTGIIKGGNLDWKEFFPDFLEIFLLFLNARFETTALQVGGIRCSTCEPYSSLISREEILSVSPRSPFGSSFTDWQIFPGSGIFGFWSVFRSAWFGNRSSAWELLPKARSFLKTRIRHLIWSDFELAIHNSPLSILIYLRMDLSQR